MTETIKENSFGLCTLQTFFLHCLWTPLHHDTVLALPLCVRLGWWGRRHRSHRSILGGLSYTRKATQVMIYATNKYMLTS